MLGRLALAVSFIVGLATVVGGLSRETVFDAAVVLSGMAVTEALFGAGEGPGAASEVV
jgi:hypothetical protein